jgi:hypothetical protein
VVEGRRGRPGRSASLGSAGRPRHPNERAVAAEGPKGWKLQARPSLEEQAATVSVDPKGEATIQAEADPPEE